MTPEQSRALLGATLRSIESWIEEAREFETCCPTKVAHLRAAMEQAHMALSGILQRDGGAE